MNTINIELFESISTIFAFVISSTSGHLVKKITCAVNCLSDWDSSYTNEEILYIFDYPAKKITQKLNNSEDVSDIISHALDILNESNLTETKVEKLVKDVYRIVFSGEMFSENEIAFAKFLLSSLSFDVKLADKYFNEIKEEAKLINNLEEFTPSHLNEKPFLISKFKDKNGSYLSPAKFISDSEPRLIMNDLPELSRYPELIFEFSKSEINHISEKIKTTRTIPILTFCKEILSEKFDVKDLKISWFFPNIMVCDRINCSMILSDYAIHCNMISPEEMNPIIHYDDMKLLETKESTLKENRNKTLIHNLTFSNKDSIIFTIDLLEKRNSISQSLIIKAILNLYKEISEYNASNKIFVIDYPGAPKFQEFNSWNELLLWSHSK